MPVYPTNDFSLIDPSDFSKRLSFDLSSFSTNTNFILTPDAASGIIALLDVQQRFSSRHSFANAPVFEGFTTSGPTDYLSLQDQDSINSIGIRTPLLTANRTLTLPDATTILAGLSVAQIWTAQQIFDCAAIGAEGIVLSGSAGTPDNWLRFLDTDTGFYWQMRVTSPSANRNVTFPDGSGQILLNNATQTVTNKTLTTGTILGVAAVLTASSASSGVSFTDGTTATKKLRLVLSGAVGNNSLIVANTAARDYTLGDAPGFIPVVGNGADPPASGAIGKVDQTAVAAAIAATNLTNATPAGFYEVSYYASCTTANAIDGTIAFQISYTDRVGATNQTTAGTLTLAATSTGATALKGTFQAYLASGNITYQTNLTGAQTTSRYALDVRCRFLG